MRGTATQQAAKRRQNLAHNTNRARFSGRQNLLALAALLVVIFCASCQRNSGGGIGSGTGGFPQPPAEVSSSEQVVKINTSPVQVAPGGSADSVVTLSISPGYHVNANPATYPYLIATEIKRIHDPDECIDTSQPIYPPATHKKFAFAEQPLAVYEDEIRIGLTVSLPKRGTCYSDHARGERLEVAFDVRVQACDTEKCFPPATINTKIPVEVK
jgi:hypothetical protein